MRKRQKMPLLFVYPREGKFFKLSLKEKRISIGRSAENDIIIKDPYSSNLHAFIYPSEEEYVLRDNKSKNGTFLNSERIQGEIALTKGDEILIGSTKLFFDKELSTNVEVTAEDTSLDAVDTMLSLKEILKKPDRSTVVQRKAKDSYLDTVRREQRLVSVITAVSQELLLHRSLSELIDKIMEIINQFLPMDRGAMMLMESNPPQLMPKIACINNKRYINKDFKVSQNILNMVMKKHSSLLISDVKAYPQLGKTSSVVIPNIRSAMCVPLWNNQEITGVIYSDRISLRKPFSEEDLRLLTLIANLAAMKIEDCRKREKEKKDDEMRKQLELASRIQRHFLPERGPDFEGFDVAGHNVPCYQVGGDYYDFIPVGSNRLGIAIADVSGKGPGAALHMAQFRTRLEVEANLGNDVQEMSARLNDFVHRETETNCFISFFFCELDNLTGELNWVNAGHNPPILLRKAGNIERLKTGGLCLGMFPSQKYEAYSIMLKRGDIAVLFTDGMTECRDAGNAEFEEHRFIKLIKKYSKWPANKMLGKIFKELDVFTKGAEQIDDMTLVIIKRKASAK
jgi:sigma-B regulation protein RsbU (phosphoserine phosphatase)